MTIEPTFLYPAVRSIVPVGGTAIISAYGPMKGGFIVNPYMAADQGLAVAENLYINIAGDAGLAQEGTTIALVPGQLFIIPKDCQTNVSVNAPSSGHRFSAVIYQPVSGFTPATGDFPPDGPVTVLKTIISYLYQEYDDDDDLQAFVDSFNGMAQQIVDWFVNTNLAVYTSDAISGLLLDWVGANLYGMPRPALPSGRNQNIGAFNTYRFNQIAIDAGIQIGNPNFYLTSDDVYKRILTWHFFKGDGKNFCVRWLKRRIMRFLIGTNGTAPNIDQTYQISVTFSPNHQVNINIYNGVRRVTGGALYNRFGFNRVRFNQINTVFIPFPPLALAAILKAGIDSGVLELPFQFTFVVTII